MKVDTDDLVDHEMIAKRAGVKTQAVSNWSNRLGDFPTPVWSNKKKKLYLWWQVEAWLRHTGRITQ